MGLVLPNPSDPDFLDTYLTSHRHLPSRDPFSNPRAKHPRRPFAWSQWKNLTRHERLAQADPEVSASPPRPHHLTLYNANLARHRQPRSPSARSSPSQAGHAYYPSDIAEGHLVALSEVPLPGELPVTYHRRPPSLSREDAFRDARTSRKRPSPSLYADDEELYRLGLLYDNEHERGEGFSLDKIVHEEMVWEVRPAKRGRNMKRNGRKDASMNNLNKGVGGNGQDFCALELALSFAALGEDDALAAWLLKPGEEEIVPYQDGEEKERRGVVVRQGSGDLTVVYELDERCDEEETQPQEEDVTAAELAVSACLAGGLGNLEETEDWAFLDENARTSARKKDGDDGSDTTEPTNLETEADADVDAWVVLCGDGSKQVRL